MKFQPTIAALVFGLLVTRGIAVAETAAPAAAPRPNIILIIADDLGCEDSTPYGCKGVHTANLDQLAQDGMKFTHAFNTCSSCSPSRSSIITGRYPHNTGAEALHMPLPKNQVTFVEKLKAAGYWTAQAGKWHLGRFVQDRFDALHFDAKCKPNATNDGSGCIRWVSTLRERPKDKPFFLWLASNDPHRPFYEETLANPHTPDETEVPPFLADTPVTRKDMAMYYDEIGRLDIYVGKVIAELKAQGVLDNTVIFFVTDNGRPFPRCKVSVYDSGIQSPLLVRWPGHVKPGSVCASLTSSIDLAPTILEIAGLPALPTFQGKSLLPLLTVDSTALFRDKVFSEHNWHDFAGYERSVRTAQFKYIHNYWPELPGSFDMVADITYEEMQRLHAAGKLTPPQMNCFITPRPSEELYDVVADPQELNNLANNPKYAATLKELRDTLENWRTETKDFIPSPRPLDSFDRVTGELLPGATYGGPPRRGKADSVPPKK